MKSDWKTKALAWLNNEKEPTYKEIIENALKNEELLEEYFGSRLEFGTAGLRGALGPGPNRMNETVVHQTSLAIARYISSTHEKPSVVIGYDARNKSDTFARLASQVFLSEGVQVYEFPYIVPTPLLAHAVVRMNASAGVMITASHNPPSDNGYKVYWSNGAQIIPPHDSGISTIFDALPFPPKQVQDTAPQEVPSFVAEEYMDAVQALRIHNGGPLRIVYTPLHGVGGTWVEQTLKRAGYTDLHLVQEQFQPDGDFPFAPFPNPEEAKSMELAFSLAESCGADIIIANDPDADRLAVAIRYGEDFLKLTGDQVGLLLANDLLKNKDWDRPMVATTIVSSSQLKSIAKEHNAEYVETLTGFKWIANAAIDHNGEFVVGFEEALGYSVADVARDKDGVSAALLICDLASKAKQEGKTLRHYLFDIYARHGFALSQQKSIKKPGATGKLEIAAMMDKLRSAPPTHIAGAKVVEKRDIQTLESTDLRTSIVTPLSLPKSNVLSFFLNDGTRIVVRPSGTEPKIKFYFETHTKIDHIDGWEQSQLQNQKRIQELINDLIHGQLGIPR